MADFTCPRCSAPATGRFYGPCLVCLPALAQLVPPPPDPEYAGERLDDLEYAWDVVWG